jgi:hypothetical protein
MDHFSILIANKKKSQLNSLNYQKFPINENKEIDYHMQKDCRVLRTSQKKFRQGSHQS